MSLNNKGFAGETARASVHSTQDCPDSDSAPDICAYLLGSDSDV